MQTKYTFDLLFLALPLMLIAGIGYGLVVYLGFRGGNLFASSLVRLVLLALFCWTGYGFASTHILPYAGRVSLEPLARFWSDYWPVLLAVACGCMLGAVAMVKRSGQ